MMFSTDDPSILSSLNIALMVRSQLDFFFFFSRGVFYFCVPRGLLLGPIEKKGRKRKVNLTVKEKRYHIGERR